MKIALRLTMTVLLACAWIGLHEPGLAYAATVTECPTFADLSSFISNAHAGDTLDFDCTSPTTITFANSLQPFADVTLDATTSPAPVTFTGGLTASGTSGFPLFTIGGFGTPSTLTVTFRGLIFSGAADTPILDQNRTVIVTDSTFSHNTSLTGSGGAIDSTGTVTVSRSTFTANTAGADGGAIDTFGGSVTVTDSTFTGNTVTGTSLGGGAIYQQGVETIAISGSTFSNNTATKAQGGAVYSNCGSCPTTSLSVTNSTFNGNSALTGGAIAAGDGVATIADSTFSANAASSGGAIARVNGTVNIGSSIIAGSTSGGNCAGTITDNGYNLTDAAGDCSLSGPTDLTNTDPQLGSLAENGGPTETMAPASTSAAIDVIPHTSCPSTDQRGVTRPDRTETSCDIGAYEFVDPDTTPPATVASLDPAAPDGMNGWYVHQPSTTLTATDPDDSSGITTYYGVDNPSCGSPTGSTTGCTTYSGPLTLSDGDHTIYFFSVDPAGNAEVQKSLEVKVDSTAPVISCGSADGTWHAGDVSIACTASDATSGLAGSSDASFNLSTSVPVNTETAVAATDSRQVCDVAGNCATAGPVGGNMIDKAAPTIAIASPATGDSYLLNQPAGASYSCTDGGSGVATCSGTVADGSSIDTASVGSKDFTVNAADNVGNSSTSDDSYSVAYATQDSAGVKHGTLAAVTQLQDYSGRNVSASTVGVTAIDIVNSAGTPVMSLGTAFTFSTKKTHGFAGSTYQVSINVSSLSPGTYSLRYQAGNDPTTHAVTFTR